MKDARKEQDKRQFEPDIALKQVSIHENSREIFIDVKGEVMGMVLVLGKAHGRVHPSPIWSCRPIRDYVTVWLTKFRRDRTLAPSVGRSEKKARKHDEHFHNIFHLEFKLAPCRMPKTLNPYRYQNQIQ